MESNAASQGIQTRILCHSRTC